MKEYDAREWNLSASEICPFSLQVQTKLTRQGYESYVVGGCVRDSLLGITPKDFDVATSAHPEEICSIFPRSRKIGRRFQIVHVRFGRAIVEVSTFRSKKQRVGVSTGGARDVVSNNNFFGTLREDMYRRDFTINAMYYDPLNNRLMVHDKAKKDLEARCLRLVTPPATSFQEDPVRILRGIRFQAKLGFQMEKSCRKQISASKGLLRTVPKARLFTEMVKLFSCGKSSTALHLLLTFGILEFLHPLAYQERNNKTFLSLLELLLDNTDNRIREGQPITPAFLVAGLGYGAMKKYADMFTRNGHLPPDALDRAVEHVGRLQRHNLSFPAHFGRMAGQIYLLQPYFDSASVRDFFRLIRSRRFRAAYDFYCLRAQAGDADLPTAEWWTQIQKLTKQERKPLLHERYN